MLSHNSKKSILPSSLPVALIYNLHIIEQCFCAGYKLFARNESDTLKESFATKSLFCSASLKIIWIFIDSLIKRNYI